MASRVPAWQSLGTYDLEDPPKNCIEPHFKRAVVCADLFFRGSM